MMVAMKRIPLLFFVLAMALPLFAQSAGDVATYVSRLRALVDGPYVKLLWKDSDLPNASYVIYRSTQELSADSFGNAVKLAEVPADQQSYVDTPPDTKSYYYAVLAQNSSGKLYSLFIPFRNVTTVGVAVKLPLSAAVQYSQVTDLAAKRSGDAILLSFHSSKSDRQLVVYRNTSPIRSVNELLASVSIGLIPSSLSEFKDHPIAGIPYYYAIVDSDMLSTGSVSLELGANATSDPVEIPLSPGTIGESEFAGKRLRPLPFLVITPNDGGAPLLSSPGALAPQTKSLSPAAQEAVDSLLGSLPAQPPQPLSPVLLDADKAPSPSAGGDEHALLAILSGPFAARDWNAAERALKDYLAIRRAVDLQTRARFYLGQCYYFEGNYRRSFMELLLVEDNFYSAVQPWLSSIFAKLHTRDEARD